MILYVLPPLAALGACCPSTSVSGRVWHWFRRFRDTGLIARISHYLPMTDRERVGREASPKAGVIDSHSVKTTESGGPIGFEAAWRSALTLFDADIVRNGRLLLWRVSRIPLLEAIRSSKVQFSSLFSSEEQVDLTCGGCVTSKEITV